MNHDQTRALLIKASTIDNRNVSPLTVDSWHELLVDVDINEALEALRAHRIEQPGVYLEPGHIIAGARRIRRDRDRYVEGREHRALVTPIGSTTRPDDFDEIADAHRRLNEADRRDAIAAVQNTGRTLNAMRTSPRDRGDRGDRRRQAQAELDRRRAELGPTEGEQQA